MADALTSLRALVCLRANKFLIELLIAIKMAATIIPKGSYSLQNLQAKKAAGELVDLTPTKINFRFVFQIGDVVMFPAVDDPNGLDIVKSRNHENYSIRINCKVLRGTQELNASLPIDTFGPNTFYAFYDETGKEYHNTTVGYEPQADPISCLNTLFARGKVRVSKLDIVKTFQEARWNGNRYPPTEHQFVTFE